jgi:hypothetical protein
MPNPTPIHTFEDGTVLGVIGNQIFKGTPKQISNDELKVKVTSNDNNENILRLTTYKDQVISKGNLNRTAVIQAYTQLYKSQGMNNPTAIALATRIWEGNLITQSTKIWMDVLDAGGNIVQVEKTVTVYDWEPA